MSDVPMSETHGHDPAAALLAPITSPCPVNQRRALMSEEEFWDDVFPQDGREPDPEDDQPDPPAVAPYDTPCAVCGTTGPCAYDANGLPLIHADEESVL